MIFRETLTSSSRACFVMMSPVMLRIVFLKKTIGLGEMSTSRMMKDLSLLPQSSQENASSLPKHPANRKLEAKRNSRTALDGDIVNEKIIMERIMIRLLYHIP